MIILYEWEKIDFYRHPYKPFHFKKVYRYFYQFAIALFAAILMYSILMLPFRNIVIVAIVIILAAILLPRFKPGFYVLCKLMEVCAIILIVDVILLCMYQQSGHTSPRDYAIVGLFVVFVIIEGIYQWRWEKYFEEISDFKKILTRDFGGFHKKYWKEMMCAKYILKTLKDMQETETEDTEGKIKDIKNMINRIKKPEDEERKIKEIKKKIGEIKKKETKDGIRKIIEDTENETILGMLKIIEDIEKEIEETENETTDTDAREG